MSKLKKCLYIIHLLERKGALSLKEINESFQYSSCKIHDKIANNFCCVKNMLYFCPENH